MRYTIGELAEIIDGDRGKNYPQQSELMAEGYCLFLNTGNVTTSGFSFESNQFITKEKSDLLRKGKLRRRDIVYTTRGTVGNAGFFSESVPYEHIRINSGMVIIRPNESVVCTEFLYQILKSSYYRPYFQQYCTGSAQPQLPIKNLSKIELDIPALERQYQIANILSAYDTLIENNQKQIKLLEEAAQRLYKEWFVDLRFPGHETTPIVNGIPEGWSRKTVEECLSFHGNGGWGKETSMGKNEHPGKVIRGTDIEDVKAGRYNDIPLRYHTDNDIKKRTLKIHDLVFELSNGNINNIGRCLLIDDLVLKNCGENTICASFCKLLRPVNRLHSLILYWEIQDMQTSGRMLPLKKHGANGINNFDFDGFLNHELLIPDNVCMLKPIEAIMAKISIIQGQFALLTEARDRLLPKLMSGEIEVQIMDMLEPPSQIVNVYLPPDFKHKSVNEPFIQKMMELALGRRNWIPGNADKFQPDYFCDGIPFEFTMASNRKDKENYIQKFYSGKYTTDDVAQDAFQYIQESIQQKLKKTYSVPNVHLCVLCLIDLTDWVLDEYGSVTHCILDGDRQDFFEWIKSQCIDSKKFNNVFVIFPDMFATWWIWDVLTGHKANIRLSEADILSGQYPFWMNQQSYEELMKLSGNKKW